jgi:hypothetical protein
VLLPSNATPKAAAPRKVKILKRAETMGDVPDATNGFGKTLRVQFWTV